MITAQASLLTPALWLTAIERWLLLAGLAVALGGLAGRGLARQYKGPRPAPLPEPWALRGSLLGLAASAALLVTSLAGPRLAVMLAQPRPLGLPAGASALIAGTEVVLFALAAAAMRFRQPGWGVVALSGVILAEALRAHPEGMIPAAGAALTVCHLLPAVLWAGMILYVLRAAFAWRADPPVMQALVRLYAVMAGWLFTAVVVTGVFSALLLVPVSSLPDTAYGRFLIVKAVLVAAVAGLAIAGRAWLRHRPPAGAGPALVTKLECAALGMVLAVTALLTVLAPPAKPIYYSGALAPATRALPATRAPAAGAGLAAAHDRGAGQEGGALPG